MFFAPVVRTRAVSPAFRTFDRNFERFVQDAFFDTPQRGLDVTEDEKAWTITLDVPGLAREDLSVGIEGAVVRIQSRPEAKRQFSAAWQLSQDIDTATSSAKLEHGVLTLTLGKLVPPSTVTQLTIQ